MPKNDQVTTDERKAERTDQPAVLTDGKRFHGTVVCEWRNDRAVAMSEKAREAAKRHGQRNKEALTELAKW